MSRTLHLFIEYKSSKSDTWYAHGGEFRPDVYNELYKALIGDKAKGRVPDMSYRARRADCFTINDTNPFHGKEVTESTAHEYVKSGQSIYRDDGLQVTNPDYHSHTWLTIREFASILKSVTGYSVEYTAILAAMDTFNTIGFDTRIVFWFDN